MSTASLLPDNAERTVDAELTERTFTNYSETVEPVNGKDRTYCHALPLPQVAADLLAHTDNWPRQIGSTLFAFAPDKSDSNQRYRTFTKPPALFAWIRETLTPRWKAGNGGARDSTGVNYVTAEELYQHLLANAKHYEGISRAPHWPQRRDQFYDYGELPPPSEGHRAFWQLIDFFCLADDTYRTLAACFFVAPMYYKTDANGEPLPRPAFMIDTVDAQGSGKTSLVNMNAALYRSGTIEVSLKQLQRDEDKIKRSILSTDGRRKRFCLIDNATDTVKDDTLARWIPAKDISGIAPYGHGDETRPNDITWCLTVNGGRVDTDAATRFYIIKVKKRETPYHSATGLKWEADVTRYITENRWQLYADILDMLDRAKPRDSDSRFPDFDATVLSAVCDTDEQFAACRTRIEADATGANVDAELAADFTEAVERYLATLRAERPELDPTLPTLLTNAVVKKELDTATGKLHEQSLRQIRDMLKSGLAPNFSKKNPRLNTNDGKGGKYPEGIVYGVHLIGDGATETAFQIVDLVPTSNGTMRPEVKHSTGTVKVATLIS